VQRGHQRYQSQEQSNEINMAGRGVPGRR
jgi:hypothetical protein